MRRWLFSLAVMCLPLAVAFGPVRAGNVNEAADLIARMTDEKASAKDRWSAEDALAKLPPGDALPRLLPYRGKDRPNGDFWNSYGDRESDQRLPIAYQCYDAIGRAWQNQITRLPEKEGGKLLVDLLPMAKSDSAKLHVLLALQRRWSSNAETAVTKFLGDPREPIGARQAAALALILNGKENFHDLLLKTVQDANAADQQRWFHLLADHRHKKKKGIDPRVIVLGFQFIKAERAKNPKYVHGAYFLAIDAAAYAGQEFAPSINDPRYREMNGSAKDAFFEATVENALQWWEKNRAKIEKSAQEKGR